MTSPTLLPVGTRCRISVPGSTSNLGPGFDAIGCAVRIRNEFEFEIIAPGATPTVTLSGARSAGIPATPRNLAITVAQQFIESHGVKAPNLSLRARIEVPSARGLGSSSTAIVAGLAAGNVLLGSPLDAAGLLDAAVEEEGHPDNVAPAILGGMVISATQTKPLVYRRVDVHRSISFIFVVPDYEVRTADARAVLPIQIPYHDAIFNASRTPLVVMAMISGDLGSFPKALEDKLHQPYRKKLFRNYDELSAAAISAGSAGFCVSGAGPTMLAISPIEKREAVQDALVASLRAVGLTGQVMELHPENQGTTAEIL